MLTKKNLYSPFHFQGEVNQLVSQVKHLEYHIASLETSIADMSKQQETITQTHQQALERVQDLHLAKLKAMEDSLREKDSQVTSLTADLRVANARVQQMQDDQRMRAQTVQAALTGVHTALQEIAK